jgi:hypothetical protein
MYWRCRTTDPALTSVPEESTKPQPDGWRLVWRDAECQPPCVSMRFDSRVFTQARKAGFLFRQVILMCLLVTISGLMFAQRTMSVAQLQGFIKSSVEQKLDDKEIAETLKKVRLSERLDQKTLGELMSLGAGPRTSAALRELSDGSAGLPAPPPPVAAVAPKRTIISTLTPTTDQQKEILEGIRDYALNYTQNLPNFLCNQVTHRSVDQTGTGDHYRDVDKIQEVLSYFEHHESYKVLAVNGQLVANKDHKKLGGAISEGEFGSMMYEIFEPQTAAEFDFDHVGTWDGQRVNEFRYHVPKERSNYSITAEEVNRTIIAGYHGMIYASAGNSSVVRITLQTEEIPPDFPVKEVVVDLRYGVATISDQQYFVPVKWDMHSRDHRELEWNSAEFTLYRKFETSSSLKFDTDDADAKPDSKDTKPQVKKQQQ